MLLRVHIAVPFHVLVQGDFPEAGGVRFLLRLSSGRDLEHCRVVGPANTRRRGGLQRGGYVLKPGKRGAQRRASRGRERRGFRKGLC